jgi:hypothetical protein
VPNTGFPVFSGRESTTNVGGGSTGRSDFVTTSYWARLPNACFGSCCRVARNDLNCADTNVSTLSFGEVSEGIHAVVAGGQRV